jgi:hypothetical protein
MKSMVRSFPAKLCGERDALTTADAQRDDAAFETVTSHGVNEPRREHGSRRADWMTMRDGAALDIDDVLGQAEFLRHGEWHGCEGLVDLDALHISELPPSALQCLAHGRDRAEAEHAGLDGRDAVRDEPGHRFD